MKKYFRVDDSTYSSSSLTYSSPSLALEPGIGGARLMDLDCGQILFTKWGRKSRTVDRCLPTALTADFDQTPPVANGC